MPNTPKERPFMNAVVPALLVRAATCRTSVASGMQQLPVPCCRLHHACAADALRNVDRCRMRAGVNSQLHDPCRLPGETNVPLASNQIRQWSAFRCTSTIAHPKLEALPDGSMPVALAWRSLRCRRPRCNSQAAGLARVCWRPLGFPKLHDASCHWRCQRRLRPSGVAANGRTAVPCHAHQHGL